MKKDKVILKIEVRQRQNGKFYWFMARDSLTDSDFIDYDTAISCDSAIATELLSAIESRELYGDKASISDSTGDSTSDSISDNTGDNNSDSDLTHCEKCEDCDCESCPIEFECQDCESDWNCEDCDKFGERKRENQKRISAIATEECDN